MLYTLTRFWSLWFFIRFLDHFENFTVLGIVVLLVLFKIHTAIFCIISKLLCAYQKELLTELNNFLLFRYNINIQEYKYLYVRVILQVLLRRVQVV